MIRNGLEMKVKQRTPKRNLLNYFLLFFIVCIFGIIVEQNVSMPQFVIRPIGVLGISALFISAIRGSDISLLFLAIYIPFSRMLVGDFDTQTRGLNLTNVIMFISVIAWLVRANQRRHKIFERSALNFLVAAFIGWGLISLVRGYYTQGSFYLENMAVKLKQWLTPILLYFIYFNTTKDKNFAKKILVAMMVAITIIGLMAIKDYIDIGSASSLDKSRVGGVFEQPNMLGGFFVYNMFLFLGFFLVYFPNIRYFLLLLPFLICFRGIMVTFSRGAYLGCAFGGLATVFFKNKVLFFAAFVLIIFAILNPILLPAGIRNRMENTFYGGQVFSTDINDVEDPSARTRIILWTGAVEMIKESPIFGVGYGLFPYLIPSYAPNLSSGARDAHNTYLILAAEMGIPSLLIFMAILFILVKNSNWLYRKTKDKFIKAFALGVLGGLFGLLLVNMFGSRMNAEEVSAYFWIYAGLIMALVRMKQKKQIT